MKAWLTIFALASVVTTAAAQAQTPPPPYGPPIGIENARKVMTAAETEAAKNNWAVVISIIDSGGNIVMLHGRFSNVGQPADWIVVDVVRLEDGLLAEHWDVIQDEVTAEESVSGLPMFGDTFPTRA